MKVDWAMLADSAEVRDGLAFILGGAFDTVTVQDLPARFQGCVIARLTATISESRHQHAVEIVVLGEDGEELTRVQGGLAIAARPQGLPVGWDQGLLIAVKLDGLVLPRLGVHRVDINLDGTTAANLNFRVVSPPNSPAAIRPGR